MSESRRAREQSCDWVCGCRLRAMTSFVSQKEHRDEHTELQTLIPSKQLFAGNSAARERPRKAAFAVTR